MNWKVSGWDVLFTAKSRSRSSAFVALINSTSWILGYSVPITGVRSMDSNLSREPVDLIGLVDFAGRISGTNGVATADGDMISKLFKLSTQLSILRSYTFLERLFMHSHRRNWCEDGHWKLRNSALGLLRIMASLFVLLRCDRKSGLIYRDGILWRGGIITASGAKIAILNKLRTTFHIPTLKKEKRKTTLPS